VVDVGVYVGYDGWTSAMVSLETALATSATVSWALASVTSATASSEMAWDVVGDGVVGDVVGR
jgi:hypothetical protein